MEGERLIGLMRGGRGACVGSCVRRKDCPVAVVIPMFVFVLFQLLYKFYGLKTGTYT